jgi:xanthine dehydrogenase YagS FAD-binding subunit
MRPFILEQADTANAAVQAAAAANARSSVDLAVRYLAGGTTLIDLMKLDVMRPEVVININALDQGPLGQIESDRDGVRLGALVRMSDAAEHADIRTNYPVIEQSLKLAASQQIRNMASLGGNVLQRTRCSYFRDVSNAACNKRNPGSGCAALDGVNRRHAVLGVSDKCIATYPGDFAQALMVLDAHVETTGAKGARTLPFAALHHTPGETPDRETALQPGEMITAFFIPALPWARRSLYLKVRDRESYEFALASAAVALDLADGVVREARIALGGVATVPWRAKEAEAAMRGKPINAETAQAAADAAFASARPRAHNRYKVALGKRTLARALQQAAALQI